MVKKDNPRATNAAVDMAAIKYTLPHGQMVFDFGTFDRAKKYYFIVCTIGGFIIGLLQRNVMWC